MSRTQTRVNGDRQISVVISPSTAEELQRSAREERRSRGAMAGIILDRWCEERRQERDRVEAVA